RIANPGRAIELEASLVELEADPDRLGQVASNLISNALKHSPDGSRVQVRVWARENDVELMVRNKGEPIPLDKQEVIFEPFVQFGDKSKRDGLGLGLYISREIVRAHGGALQVKSSPEETVFIARLPR